MSGLAQDLRFAGRMLSRTPGFTAAVVLSLGLGTGAGTAIFTLLNALTLKPLPVEQPERLALYSEGNARGFIHGQSGRWEIFSYPLYRHLRERQRSLEGVAAFRTHLDRLGIRTEGRGAVEPAWGRMVSGNYFSVLGVNAAIGRTLTAGDEDLAATPVAVLSFDYWSRRHGADPSVVGRALNMNGVFVTVVGVAPAGFFGESVESELADVWLPLTLQPRIMQRPSALESDDASWLNLIGRLKTGVARASAQADVNVAFRQFLLDRAGAGLTAGQRSELQRNRVELTSGASGLSALRHHYSRALRILLAAVGVLLLIACANVANLLLSRAAARRKEISMRLALGAGRGRLVRQLLTESLLFAGLGGALGVLLSRWMVHALVAAVSTGERAVPLDTAPDAAVLGFALAVCVSAALLFGLAPAWQATRVDLAPALRGAAPAGRARPRLARAFVAVQVALAVPLLAGGALLLVQSLRHLGSQDFGYAHQQVLEVGIDPGIAGYGPDRLESLYAALLERVNAVAGVRAASLSLYSPMSGNNWSGPVEVEGYAPPPKQPAFSQWVWVGPRYAETLGMTLVLGRDLSARDTSNSGRVALVNESFVRRYFAGRSPIGRRFVFRGDWEIVGVVKDIKFNNPRQEVWPVAFMPLVQAPFEPARFARYLEVRAASNAADVAASVRQALRQVDPHLPVTGIHPLSRQIGRTMNREKLIAAISAAFAAAAMLLACMGIYGTASYAAARRTREIGVRMALGASQSGILRMVLREALVLTAAGIAVGLLAAAGLTRTLSSLLYGLEAGDPATFMGVVLLLVLTAAAAGFLPARRVSRVDPAAILQAE